MGHGYVFSIGEWLKLVPCFVRERAVDSEGGGGGAGSFLKINILAVKHFKKIFWPGSLGK